MATKVSKNVTTSEVFNPDLIPQAEAEAGVANTERLISALRMKQAIDALGNGGDVVGPASATDTAIPLFDGATGKLIKNSPVVVDGSGEMSGGGVGGMTLATLGSPDFSTVQEMNDTFHSAGCISGGAIIDNGDNTINVSEAQIYIRAIDSSTSLLVFSVASAGVSLSVPVNTTRYVYVKYNSGSPTFDVATSDEFNNNTEFIAAVVTNEAGTIYISISPQNVADHAASMIQRIHDVQGIQRNNHLAGNTLGETGTRNITVTAGELWNRLTVASQAAFDSSASGTFNRYYRDGAGGHTIQSAQTQWNNTQYDDGTGSLATLGSNKWATQWFYETLSGAVLSVYGTAEHNSEAAAEGEAPPTDVAGRISDMSVLLGVLVFKKSDATATSIRSAFTSEFSAAQVTTHGELSGLDDITGHLWAALVDGSRPITGPQTYQDKIISDDTTAATSGTVGAIQTDGGIAAAGGVYIVGASTFIADLFLAANLTVQRIFSDSTQEATSTTVAAIQTDGGIACVKDMIMGGNLQVDGGDVILNSLANVMRANTTDGSDNAHINIASGGADSETRGAFIQLFGNEFAVPGSMRLNAGDVAGGGEIVLYTGAAIRLTIERAGNVLIANDLRVAGGDIIGPASGNFAIYPNTSDTTDNAITYLCGGGTIAQSRGAFIELSGNESAALGDIKYYAGNGTNGRHLWLDAGGTAEMIMDKTGNMSMGQNLAITGALSKGSGTFQIDHPLDPENKDLFHGFVEAPRYDLIYRGRAKLINGTASVSIDASSNMTEGTFVKLVQNIQVSSLQNNETFDRVIGVVVDGVLTITCENNSSTATIDWVVIAERADAFIKAHKGNDADGHLLVEVDKEDIDPAMLAERIVETDDADHVTEEIVTEARGKKGYVRHGDAYPNSTPLPTRMLKLVTPVKVTTGE